MLGSLFHSAFVETLIELFFWILLLLLALAGGTPVILIRALKHGLKFFNSLAADYRTLLTWWWDHHPFQ